jgi:hypothetical protein
MAIKGPSFGNSTPDPSAVPAKPKSTATTSASSPGKNLALAAGGGVVLFIFIAALASNTNNSSTTTTATPNASSNETSTTITATPNASSNESTVATLWGAYAADNQTNAYGRSWDASSEQEAIDKAIESCKKAVGNINCQKLISFGQGHAAIARAEDGSWGAMGQATTEEEAKSGALGYCKQTSRQPDTCTIDETFKF